MNKVLINKYIEYVQTKVKIVAKEKKYRNDGYRLKYILEQNESDVLIIVFSGCTRIGIKARYNYNRTLQNTKVNKLFILDDFGYDSRGAYYLAHNMDFKIEKLVRELVKKVQKELNIKKSIYIGTSKGGYAALYFGLEEESSTIIAGAPQYHLGEYLNSNDIYIENTLKYIVGKDVTDEKILYLNKLLKEKVSNFAKNRNLVYLHISKREPTYEHHVHDLISDLDANNVNYKLDIGTYSNHSDVSLFFPKYLIETLDNVFKQ